MSSLVEAMKIASAQGRISREDARFGNCMALRHACATGNLEKAQWIVEEFDIQKGDPFPMIEAFSDTEARTC